MFAFDQDPSKPLESQPDPLEESVPPQETNIEQEVALLKDQLLRALAEAENIRKRSEREKEDMARYAVAKFAKDLLALADTFSQALTSLPADFDQAFQPFVEGIKMTDKELKAIFERHGIEAIHPLNQPFDHNFHQAMFDTETDEALPDTVLQVLQTGYKIYDRLLRPALVAVAKPKA